MTSFVNVKITMITLLRSVKANLLDDKTVKTLNQQLQIWYYKTVEHVQLVNIKNGLSSEELPVLHTHPAHVEQMKFSLSVSGKPTHCCPPVASMAPVKPQSYFPSDPCPGAQFR